MMPTNFRQNMTTAHVPLTLTPFDMTALFSLKSNELWLTTLPR